MNFEYTSGQYKVWAPTRDRQMVFHSASRPAISDGWQAIEIEWLAASTAGANDGRFALWIDGSLKDELTGMDFTPLDYVRLGAVDKVDATTQGVYYFDAFESRRDGYIGPLAANGGTNSVVAAANSWMAGAPRPTSASGNNLRPLKRGPGRTYMTKPAVAAVAGQTVTNTTNSVTAQTGGEIIIQRVTYSLAGQVTAVRVTGDPEPTNNGLFYLHSDHLGSVSAMSDASGALVPGSVARYTPFGGWRTEPTAGLTDRGYTGHKSNNLGGGANDLGLVYMNARYYVPGVARFASADTIVPNPTNPQSFNRYSYVLNNPVKHTDPSGHCINGGDNGASGGTDIDDPYYDCSITPPPSTNPSNSKSKKIRDSQSSSNLIFVRT